MRPGDVIAGRFEVDRPVGSSGADDVCRAFDRRDGGVVALRRIHVDPGERARLERVVAIRAELRHPAIARHVASGEAGDGALFVATEWLEGEGLAARLAAGPLSVEDTLRLARRIAAALAIAHAKGIAHRGIEPASVILEGGAVDRARLIGLGAPRPTGARGYLAPEQARGEGGDGARSDVFSLGCVLFECLAGRPPFTGDDPVAVLAKVVLEEAPRVSSLREDVSEGLDALLARMLAKSPGERPGDAASLALELDAIDPSHDREGFSDATAPDALTQRDRRRLYAAIADGGAEALSDEALAAALAPLGARVDRLAGGAVVMTLAGRGNAADQAALAALAALALRRLLPGAQVALATSVGTIAGELPVGEVLDRAARMLAALKIDGGSAGVRVDEILAGLLDARFEVGGDARGLELRGERVRPPPAGAPFTGRERELAALVAAFRSAAEEEIGHAVVVSGVAGVGKTRLVDELFTELARRGELTEVWSARGTADGARFGVAAELLRDGAGMREGELPVVRWQKLRGRVRRHVASRHAERVTGFLSEVLDLRDPEQDGPELRAARSDPGALLEGVHLAFTDLLSVECDARPLVLVIDDVHLADEASVDLIGAALGALAERRLLVLATARPELPARYPALWAERSVASLALGPHGGSP